MSKTPPVVLTIAGFDPSSGAGVTADLKTIAAHGCYGVACITALTVQSTQGVRRVEPIAAGMVRDTLRELASDVNLSAIHIGMLWKADIVQVVSDFIKQEKIPPVILDPVLRSSSGAPLLDAEGTRLLVELLLPQAAVVTPNIDEATLLTGLPVRNLEEMRIAADRLHVIGSRGVVITGGHLNPAVDLLSVKTLSGSAQKEFSSPSLDSKSTHGTGCAFATALACQLALGRDLDEAVSLAKAFVREAISHAYPLGKGIGPINHLYRLQN